MGTRKAHKKNGMSFCTSFLEGFIVWMIVAVVSNMMFGSPDGEILSVTSWLEAGKMLITEPEELGRRCVEDAKYTLHAALLVTVTRAYFFCYPDAPVPKRRPRQLDFSDFYGF